MGSTMNLVMTSLGFALSAVFIIFIVLRLLCARLHTTHFRAFDAAALDSIPIEQRVNALDPGTASLLPTIKYIKVFTSSEDATCSICLIRYEEREIIRILPQCGHAFHVKCIDAWFRRHSTCPICRVHIQSFPLQRNTSLLYTDARCRFNPEVIPESLFEHPLLTLGRQTSTCGENIPHKCETCNKLQGCECGSEMDARRTEGEPVCIDIEGLTMSSNLSLADNLPGGASECSSNNVSRCSRNSHR